MEFSYDRKVKIAEKISRMRGKKNKHHLKQIIKIIEENNFDAQDYMTKNSNGIFIPDFESYSYETFTKLSNYLEEIENLESEITDSKSNTYYSEKTDERSDNIKSKKLKYTNSENHILNKMKYEKELKKHQSECEDMLDKKDNSGSSMRSLKNKDSSEGSDSNKKQEISDNIFKKQNKSKLLS
jgi:hypothetical protein